MQWQKSILHFCQYDAKMTSNVTTLLGIPNPIKYSYYHKDAIIFVNDTENAFYSNLTISKRNKKLSTFYHRIV